MSSTLLPIPTVTVTAMDIPTATEGDSGFGGGCHVATHRHHGRSFAFIGDPFYDPFYYSYIPPSIPYPYRTVTFANGRVVSFQSLVGPYRY